MSLKERGCTYLGTGLDPTFRAGAANGGAASGGGVRAENAAGVVRQSDTIEKVAEWTRAFRAIARQTVATFLGHDLAAPLLESFGRLGSAAGIARLPFRNRPWPRTCSRLL
jgi:hypothetical protein